MRYVHVMLRGRVQGVGYRAWCARTAEAQGLKGFVRNRRDGAVEAVFAGADAVVEAMLDACRAGPPGARVDDMLVHEVSDTALAAGGRERFAVLETL
ncbi:acylphosphatase [Xanthobacter autotrophicus]|jgi:acylphosphatase|uniref:acylphosphatase n=1 Tax=Xanthobacter autotrophicus TaxID=280 RepID=A0A6C1KGL1_XANAU|nr:acylphosphatase [Xanthobacter autotrophicus]TLX42717.1 acylphosphatase [Xanthobacter autotrophicus]